MTSVLVPLAGVKTFLGIDEDVEDYDELLTAMIDEVERAFLREAGRADLPFLDATTGRTEVHDGTGAAVLYLNYPVETLTTVLIGTDSGDPDETLDVDDVDVLQWLPNTRRLVRADGGLFGERWQANVVHVTYNTAADLPADARTEITRAVAALFRRRGSEGSSAERIGPYSTDFSSAYDSGWRSAVADHRVVHI